MPPRIVHETTGKTFADDIVWARSFGARLRGLIGRELPAGSALVLEPAAQIHTFAMRGPIDVVFCREDWSVVHVIRGMQPYRISRWVRGSRRAIELPAGAIPEALKVGDHLLVF